MLAEMVELQNLVARWLREAVARGCDREDYLAIERVRCSPELIELIEP